jgi:dihydrofolate reductase
MFATRFGREMLGQAGSTGGVDDAFARLFAPLVGAEIMGAGKFGPPRWHEDPEWKDWWDLNPPFHTPVFVLTHHPRPSIMMERGTMFHFIDAAPAEALQAAREAADGQGVRIGGDPTIIRDFLAAGLVDHMHIVVIPILLGRGVRLWDGLEGFEKDYVVETVSSPSGVAHVTFTRASVEITSVESPQQVPASGWSKVKQSNVLVANDQKAKGRSHRQDNHGRDGITGRVHRRQRRRAAVRLARQRRRQLKLSGRR